MAETLTINTTPQTETLSEDLTPDEQDSLKVGEELVSEHENLLAGKYKNAEELEKAYTELQKKLGEGDTESKEEVTEKETETSPVTSLLNEASAEYYDNDNSLSKETLSKLSELNSSELVEAYLELQKNSPPTTTESSDLSDADVTAIKQVAGGDDQYARLVEWASNNLPKSDVDSFDELLESGNKGAIQLAVKGLKAQYEDSNGYEGRMLQGKPPLTSKDGFRSQAELVEAMSDPRYDRDEAYRMDVRDKLERSDINF